MAGAVTFDYTTWLLRYPEFAPIPQARVQLFFNEATRFCKNCLGPVNTVEALRDFLNMVTAHIASLNTDVNGNPKPPNAPVGRLSDATEGTVSASYQNDYAPGTPQWFQQTPYGSEYWAATAQFRTFRYRAPCNPNLGDWPGNGEAWLYPNGR